MKQITSNSERFNKLLLIIEQHHKKEALRLLNKIAKDWAPFDDIKGELKCQFRLGNKKSEAFIEAKSKEYSFQFTYLLKRLEGNEFKIWNSAIPVTGAHLITDSDKVIWEVIYMDLPPFKTF